MQSYSGKRAHDDIVLSPVETDKCQRKRDSKEDERESTRFESVSAVQSKSKEAGKFSLYPEVTPQTVTNLEQKGITSLFPIQQNCLRPIYNRKDIIARDLTGSGKTLAFALPTVEYLRKQKLFGSQKVQAIVLAPTRELALQVTNTFSYLKHSPNEYRCVTVYGGVSIEPQIQQLRQGVEIFVGTTGRVLDHIERGNIDFSSLKTVILDEADQMLKLGFKEDIERILQAVKAVTRDIQICLFSATIPDWVRDVANEHMKPDLQMIDLCQDLKNKTARKVQHLTIETRMHNRVSILADLLSYYGGCQGKIIVFTQTKKDANELLMTDKIKCEVEVMHGDIPQNQREITLKRFRDGKIRCLVATDVAARGLDIPSVDLVVQIEPPKETETYIHRSGRTARAGASGVCITMYTQQTRHWVDQIEHQAGITLTPIEPPSHNDVISSSAKGMLTTLEVVKDEVLPLFNEAASTLMTKEGDPIKALSRCLAFISGHHQKDSKQRSDTGNFCPDPDYDQEGGYSSKSKGFSGGGRGGRGGRGGGGRGSRGSNNFGGGSGGYRQHNMQQDCFTGRGRGGPNSMCFSNSDHYSSSVYSTPSSRGGKENARPLQRYNADYSDVSYQKQSHRYGNLDSVY